MVLNIHDALVEIKITSSVCSAVAVAMTLYRLYARRGRFWYDDAWAVFSLLCLLLQVVSVFMHVSHPSDLSKLNRVAAYYLLATTFYAVIWSARLSILFSVIRLEPDPIWRRRLQWSALALFLAVCVLLAQLFWVCEPEPRWKDLPSPQCTLNKQVAVTQLVTDVLSDALLVFAPLRMIRGLANSTLRRRLMFIFSTAVVTTVVSLVHAAYILRHGGTKILVAALVEDTVSLMVANLPVVVTAAFRAAGAKVDAESAPPPVGFTSMGFSRRTGAAESTLRGTRMTTLVGKSAEEGTLRVGVQTETLRLEDLPRQSSDSLDPKKLISGVWDVSD